MLVLERHGAWVVPSLSRPSTAHLAHKRRRPVTAAGSPSVTRETAAVSPAVALLPDTARSRLTDRQNRPPVGVDARSAVAILLPDKGRTGDPCGCPPRT